MEHSRAGQDCPCGGTHEKAAAEGALITLSAHMPNFEVIDQRVKAFDAANGAVDLSDSEKLVTGQHQAVRSSTIFRLHTGNNDRKYRTADYARSGLELSLHRLSGFNRRLCKSCRGRRHYHFVPSIS